MAVFLSLSVVPVVNILSASSVDAIRWMEKSFIYNMDFASRWMAKLLYPLGISTNPKQAIVGRDGWIYLGDQYEQTRTVDRRPPSNADFALGQEVGRAAEAWDSYLASKGVELFRVMIGPNKGSIYPEYLPVWARPSSPNATDALLAGTGTAHYVDLRGPLLAAKSSNQEAMYYRTDTHWNYFGAGIAFRAFAQQVSPAAPDIKWPSQDAYEVSGVTPRAGGDLANFLRLTAHLSDYEPIIKASSMAIRTTHLDFDTKKVLHQGGNQAVGSPKKPLLVQSMGALNNKRVLWLRDSFGTALSPLMSATFSETLQLHWAEAIKPGGRFVQLVEDWKPDYVFITVVERASRSPWFAAYPPPVIAPVGDGFKSILKASILRSNHLEKGAADSDFQITGIDPFVDFSLSNSEKAFKLRYLSIDLTCADNAPSVPVQLFWLESGRSYFDEERSVRLSLPAGQSVIDLHTIPKWLAAGSIERVRLDIDSKNKCTHFKLNHPSFGIDVAKSH